jgi:hypothetical protein
MIEGQEAPRTDPAWFSQESIPFGKIEKDQRTGFYIDRKPLISFYLPSNR